MRPQDKEAYIQSKKRMFSQSSHVDHSICGKCGGTCCKNGGCGLMPCDVQDMSVNGIRRMLDTGKYSITFFCAELVDGIIEPIPIMKAREVNAGRVNNSIIHRPCALQRKNGCIFSDIERPTLALLFIPNADGNCKLLVDELEVICAWYPYKEMMDYIVLAETGKSSQELFYSGCVQAAMEIRQKLDMGKELTQAEMRALQILNATGVIALLGE